MGEYAERMINGEDCAGCGEYLGEGRGYPRYCSEYCAKRCGETYVQRKPRKTPLYRIKRKKLQKMGQGNDK